MRLIWHNYRYYPYERDLAFREVATLFGNPVFRLTADGVEWAGEPDSESISRLTYFARAVSGPRAHATLQDRLENSVRLGRNRQATRYSVHGLHEYKGKFNPQVAKALLNIFAIEPGQHVLDPFCGSGTTLVECTHLGVTGCGIDLNPLAVFLANAKLRALSTSVEELRDIRVQLATSLRQPRQQTTQAGDDLREQYLRSWFDPDTLEIVEFVGAEIRKIAGAVAPVFLALASDLLREYSLQDPRDLRCRRRTSPLPDTPFIDALLVNCARAIERIEAAQTVLGTEMPPGRAIQRDVTTLALADLPAPCHAVITSPPYAMALPYIDTQRLSLVWLDLLPPDQVRDLEADLIGSREMRGPTRNKMLAAMQDNEAGLPEAEAALCCQLQEALGAGDGFRRRAVPVLLYRYFALMQRSFRAVRGVMRQKAPCGLIVGRNHTTLGGIRHDIDTPAHLAALAVSVGWRLDEMIPLQTYRRYGYHVSNAVKSETLVLLRNP